MTIANDPRRLDDGRLLEAVRALVARSNQTEADLLDHLAEVDERRLYLPNHTSMFSFCTAELGFSEAAAENRIAVARAGRRFPRVIDMLRSGAIHLSGLRILVPHLSEDCADALLEQAQGKSKRAIEEIAAGHAPKPAVADCIRKVPERRVPAPLPAAEAPARETGPLFAVLQPRPPRPAAVAPLAPDRYHVQLEALPEAGRRSAEAPGGDAAAPRACRGRDARRSRRRRTHASMPPGAGRAAGVGGGGPAANALCRRRGHRDCRAPAARREHWRSMGRGQGSPGVNEPWRLCRLVPRGGGSARGSVPPVNVRVPVPVPDPDPETAGHGHGHPHVHGRTTLVTTHGRTSAGRH